MLLFKVLSQVRFPRKMFFFKCCISETLYLLYCLGESFLFLGAVGLRAALCTKSTWFSVPKSAMDSAALGTVTERKLLLCGKERSTIRIIAWLFLSCELKLSPS